jgi:TetR/AcrR family transcriptional regulator, mexCD-oprJ operon repressor
VTRNPVMHDRIATAILDAAARAFAERGEAASMADIATEAGIGRTTLYRYFPNREALLRALFTAGLTELAEGIAGAGLESVDFAEGISRFTRTTFATISKYRALALINGPHRAKGPEVITEVDRSMGEPLRALFQRGREAGELRDDMPVETLFEVYSGLMQGAFQRALGDRLGVEQASAALTGVFLSGALTTAATAATAVPRD